MVTWLKSNGVLRSIYVLIYLHGKMCTMHVRMETLEDMSDDDEDQPAAKAAATAGSQAGFSAQLLIKYWSGCPTLRYHESYIFTILKFSSIIINCYYISPAFTNFHQFSPIFTIFTLTRNDHYFFSTKARSQSERRSGARATKVAPADR